MPKQQQVYERGAIILEMLQKCQEYEELYNRVSELGFPNVKHNEERVKNLQDPVQLGKYLAAHYLGNSKDMLAAINKHLVELGHPITDDLQCETVATSNCRADLIGAKYNYKQLFDVLGTQCPEILNSYEHLTTEIITKQFEKTSEPQIKHMTKIRQYISDLLKKLDLLKQFKHKLQNIKSKAAEDKLIAQFENLVGEYNKVRLRGFDFSENLQKKEKTEKKTKQQVEQQVEQQEPEKQPEIEEQQNPVQEKSKARKKREKAEQKITEQVEQPDQQPKQKKQKEKKEKKEQKEPKEPKEPKQPKEKKEDKLDPKQRTLENFFKPKK